jgi:hypothetical protein
MSKATESNLNEFANVAGDGSGLQLPPSFVLVNPKQHRKYKKSNKDSIDGRTRGAKNLLSRISRRKKMKEELEQLISEKAPSATEKVQKQISQQKELNRRKDLQAARDKAKQKFVNKSNEMKALTTARLTDFQARSQEKQKKVSKVVKSSYELTNGQIMTESTAQLDALEVALQVATSELTHGETQFAKIQFDDGSTQNLDNFSAKKIAAVYSQLDDDNQTKFRYLLNKNAASYQTALDFAVRNI